jgi:hypothetical protein
VKRSKKKIREMKSAEITLSSAEAEIGIKVEDIWQGLEPQLTHSEKLNSCFKELEVSSFPSAPFSQGEVLKRMTAFLWILLKKNWTDSFEYFRSVC